MNTLETHTLQYTHQENCLIGRALQFAALGAFGRQRRLDAAQSRAHFLQLGAVECGARLRGYELWRAAMAETGRKVGGEN